MYTMCDFFLSLAVLPLGSLRAPAAASLVVTLFVGGLFFSQVGQVVRGETYIDALQARRGIH